MKKNKSNLIIVTLTIILLLMSTYTINKYKKIQKENNKSNIIQIDENINMIDKKVLIEKLNNETKLLALSGDTSVEVTYTNKDISDEDVNFQWLKNKFKNLSSKDLKIQAKYKIQFHYDLNDLDVILDEDIPRIHLSKNRISSQVELIENESIYIDRVGMFESSFTPSEINSLNERTKNLVLNKIQNDELLIDKTIQNVKANINKILDIECVFTTSEYGNVSTQDNVNIISN